MKKCKFIAAISLATVLGLSVTVTAGCSSGNVLKVYNCFDYIQEELLDEFEDYYYEKTGTKIKVEYEMFDTPEDAYNKIKIESDFCDLVCPSDYMIEKMAREGMLEEFEMPDGGYYKTNVSPYIANVFNEIAWGDGEEKKSLSNYAAGYMWGTLGLVYNTEKVSSSDMSSWSSLWNLEKINKKFTIKNSVRDTYFVGLAKYHADKLNAAKSLDESAYRAKLKELFNDTSSETVSAVKSELLTLKNKAWKLEVDDGKTDIINKKSDVYFAWSGDAVYAMGEAEEAGVSLEYSVPEEGSNIWFDGWCIPKGSDQKQAAIEFIDFLSKPENAIRNMDYIGYVSVIAGDKVFDYVKECYEENDGTLTVDLGYFFGEGNYTVKYKNKYGVFAAQYPAEEVVSRCVVMNYFSDDANARINNMWMEVTQ